ncbi:MAG TPA: hypothetical protein VKV19_04115 [Ktedonobacteraceae bacterium]|nr:hypothetical protein [Ktedonobacteraceae bacterium]
MATRDAIQLGAIRLMLSRPSPFRYELVWLGQFLSSCAHLVKQKRFLLCHGVSHVANLTSA